MRSPLNALAVLAIRGYQRFISPHKGWCCAHAHLHHGSSCSAYGLARFRARSFHLALADVRRRLTACSAAADELDNESEEERDRRLNRRYLRARRQPSGNDDPDDCFLSPTQCKTSDCIHLVPHDCFNLKGCSRLGWPG